MTENKRKFCTSIDVYLQSFHCSLCYLCCPFFLSLIFIYFFQSIEQDLGIHHRLFNQISERAQKIKDHLEKGSLGVLEITDKIEKLTQRWDSLVLLMENVGKKASVSFLIFDISYINL